jgi:hypothetical protein
MGHEVTEEKEMNTIEIDGKTYEVLTGWARNVTHAQMATGIRSVDASHPCILIDGDAYTMRQVNANKIQPLRLMPKEPVTWVCEFGNSGDGFWFPIYCLDDALAYQHKEKKRFRCVEIVEEAK